MIIRWIAASAISTLLAGSAAAASAPVMVVSYGSNNCERFSRATYQEKTIYLAWTEGFISGANTRDVCAGRMAGIFWHQADNIVWLQAYCVQNPQAAFMLAAEAFRTALGGHRPP